MNFLLGMAVGGMLFSGDGTPPASSFGSIPLRCIYAFEQSAEEFRACRMPSLYRELREGMTPCGHREITDDKNACALSRHLGWEVGMLSAIKAARAAKESK